MFVVSRSQENPIITPVNNRPWESVATFNPSVIKEKNKTYLFYRAMAKPDALITPYAGRSTIGLAISVDGGDFADRKQVIVPSCDWDKFGCEDPRATFFEGKWYVFYTALSGYPYSADKVHVGVAIGDSPDRLKEKYLVTPFNSKAAALFPERISGKVALILSAHTDSPPASIAIALADNVEDFWSPEYWNSWHKNLNENSIVGLRRNDNDFVEVGAVPVKTNEGWLLVYSGIQNYYGGGDRVFGIEAAVLDENNLKSVVSKTAFPLLVPEEVYEKFGLVPDVVFPTGLIVEDDIATIYYGGADTVCSKAKFKLSHLLGSMRPENRANFSKRVSKEIPILSPISENSWEAKAVFNPAALDTGDAVHVVYRAMGHDNTSVLGLAKFSADGTELIERLNYPIYFPRLDFELKKGSPDGNSGCEDPRLSLIDGTVHLCYTAYNGVDAPRGAHSSISLDDFLKRNFDRWSEPVLMTPYGISDKDVCIFPEKINGNFVIIHRIDPTICAEEFESLPPKELINKCTELAGPRKGMWDTVKVGAAGPPIRIREGWLFIYHAVGSDRVYRLGAILLDGEKGQTVIARTASPILEPVEKWEREGQVGNVVFGCGAAIKGDNLIIYYGGADSVIGVAIISLSDLVSRLLPKI